MNYQRPIVLSVAGFDPTGGAGALADMKTVEQFSCLGMSVLTSTTIQTETDFISVDWFSEEQILAQLNPLVTNYRISAIKIGIIQNLNVLTSVTTLLKKHFQEAPIVWDPVLAASSGFVLHESWNPEAFQNALSRIDLITPNVHEARQLMNCDDELVAAFQLGQFTNVLLKGGHSSVRRGIDFLIENGIPTEIQADELAEYAPKHGSGCILSAALTANLALGKSLQEASRIAKRYTEERLASNPNLLAYHVE